MFLFGSWWPESWGHWDVPSWSPHPSRQLGLLASCVLSKSSNFFLFFKFLLYYRFPYPFQERGRWQIRRERQKERTHPDLTNRGPNINTQHSGQNACPKSAHEERDRSKLWALYKTASLDPAKMPTACKTDNKKRREGGCLPKETKETRQPKAAWDPGLPPRF